MNNIVMPAAAFVFALIAAGLFIRWRKAAAKAKQGREQIDRKRKEDALDRALSNGLRPGPRSQAEAPVEVHYSGNLQKERGSMLRLTEQAESVRKEYLFQRTSVVYIGEEYGRPAIFQERGREPLYCELFPHQDGMYVRLCGKAECRLIRGRQTAPLTPAAIRLHSKDKIETKSGVFAAMTNIR